MALKYIIGGSGSGKTSALYKEIIEKSMANPEKNYILIVPEQYTMQTQKNIVNVHPRGGVLNVDIVSFGRLAYRVFNETKTVQKNVLEDAGKSMVIRKVVSQKQDELTVFKGNIRKKGFIGEVKSMLSELFQYNVSPDQLQKAALELHQPMLGQKMQDVLTLYQGFKEYMGDAYMTAEEILGLLNDCIGQSEVMKNSEIYLDEFTGFTPAQYQVLEKMLMLCQNVTVTLTIDLRQGKKVLEKIEDEHMLFHLTEETYHKLENLALKNHVPRGEDLLLNPPNSPRYGDKDDLMALERQIFRFSKVKPYTKVPQQITVHQVKNPEEEIHFVGRKIQRAMKEGRYRYRDIAIVSGDIGRYQVAVEQIFRSMDIPYFMDNTRSIMNNALIFMVRSMLGVFYQNFSYESVFSYLRCGFTGLTMEEIDILENYVLALGIRGYSRWSKKWTRRYRDYSQGDYKRLNEMREKVMEPLTKIWNVQKDKESTVDDLTDILIEIIESDEVTRCLESMIEDFSKTHQMDLQKEYEQIYNVLMDLLEKMQQILSGEKVQIKDYIDILEAGLEDTKIGIIPPGVDQVVIGDIKRTRLDGIKVLFFVGVNDGVIPTAPKEGGLIGDRDKEILKSYEIELAPTAKQSTFTEQFYIYSALTKPTNRLIISFSKVESTGKAIRPSYLIGQIGQIFPQMEVSDEDEVKPEQLLDDPKAALAYVVMGIRGAVSGEEKAEEPLWKELFSWYKKHPLYSRQLKKYIEKAFYINEEEHLPASVVKALYGEHPVGSVTTLEKYAACAYAHFLSYGLRLKEREEYKVQMMDLGTIFHEAIETFSKQLSMSEYNWFDLPDERRDAMARNCVEDIAGQYNNTIFQDNARYQYMIERIVRMTKRTLWALQKQVQRGEFVPSDYEVAFSSEMGLSAMQVGREDQVAMSLQGKIDRVDILKEDEEIYLKILDYKSGKKAFDLAEIYYGLQLQLVVYMTAVSELVQNKNPKKVIIPAGMFYYNIDDPLIETDGKKSGIEDDILGALKMNGLVNSDLEVIKKIDNQVGEEPEILPVGINKDGSLSKRSSVAGKEQWEDIEYFASRKINQLGEDILSGKVLAAPYKKKKQSACDYCEYKGICGFDLEIEGCDFHKIMDLSAKEVWEKISKEAGSDE